MCCFFIPHLIWAQGYYGQLHLLPNVPADFAAGCLGRPNCSERPCTWIGCRMKRQHSGTVNVARGGGRALAGHWIQPMGCRPRTVGLVKENSSSCRERARIRKMHQICSLQLRTVRLCAYATEDDICQQRAACMH